MAYPASAHKQAINLRKRGLTYSEISLALGVAKGTLSTWMGINPRTPSDKKKQRAHLVRARLLASEAKRRIRRERLERIAVIGKSEAGKLNLADRVTAKALLAMLYWAEGAKGEKAGPVKFANTDPALALLFISLLRTTYPLDEKKFRIRLHLHYYHAHKTTIDFWSKLLHVPKSQFGKIYVKKRSRRKRFRKNFSGICFVIYHDTNVRDEIMVIARTIGSRASMLSSSSG